MDLTLLRSFVAVVDAGNVTTAGERIGVTQPALSRRLGQLEDFLGAELLVRGRKGVAPTESGELVAAEARAIIERFDQLRLRISSRQRLESGTVRIGGGATAVSFLLPQAIGSFQRQHPGIRFKLREAGSREIASAVGEGRIELGLVTLPIQPRLLSVRPVVSDRIVLAARRDHPLAERDVVTIADLSGLPLVGFEGGSAIRQIIDGALRDAGIEIDIVMELRSIPAILRMVATTGHAAFVSQLGLERQQDIREIRVSGLNISRSMALIAKRDGHLSPAAEAFAEHLLVTSQREGSGLALSHR